MTAGDLEKHLKNLTDEQKKLPIVFCSNRGELVEVTSLGFYGRNRPAYQSVDGPKPAKSDSLWNHFGSSEPKSFVIQA